MRIMCVGASITMGEGVNGGYRLPLEKMFEGAGIPVQFVGRIDLNSHGMTSPWHDGYSGLRVDQVHSGVPGTCAPIADGVRELQPDVVLVLCGTNDVRQNYELNNAPSRLDHLIGAMQEAAPSVRILVSSIPPDVHFDDAVRRYNAGIAAVVARRASRGEKVGFVDNYATMNANVHISLDRTHPNQMGYNEMARNWFNALAPAATQVAFALTRDVADDFVGSSCFGYQITTKTQIRVSALGIYCAGRPLSGNRSVGVFDEKGMLLAQVEVTPEHVPSGLFAYEPLAKSLTLETGRSYFFVSNSTGLPVLKATNSLIDPFCFDNPRFYFDHNVASTSEGKRLSCPSPEIHDLDGGVGYFGPIFRLEPYKQKRTRCRALLL